jgi:hypothetical protein
LKLVRIEEAAFLFPGLKSIIISSSVDILHKSYFGSRKLLESIILENDSKLIRTGKSAFSRSVLKPIIIPSSMKGICGASRALLAEPLLIHITT